MKMMHVTIQTKYFDEEIKFYQEIVGLKIKGEIKGMGRNIVFLGGNDEDTKIEIIQKPDADMSGNMHISLGYKSEDLKEQRAKLIAEGYEVSEMISPAPGIQFFFTKDPAGVTIQFM